jgi:FdhD protein
MTVQEKADIVPDQAVSCRQYIAGKWETVNDHAIVEASVSLTVNGEMWLTLMCTPVDLDLLAVGLLHNEGLIETAGEIASVRLCPNGDNVDVWLRHSVVLPKPWRRTSGCSGGVTAIDPGEIAQQRPESLSTATCLNNGVILAPQQVCELISMLSDAQTIYRKTGGVHTSALSNGQKLLVVTEDIGRHNTLDKIAGKCLLDGIYPERRILVTTGRISSEMLQKAARIGSTMVISRTSPSSLSVQMAEQWGITLVGYARRDRFIVYTHPERILESNHDE